MERAGTTNLRSLERTFGSSFVGYSTPFLNFDNFAFVATAIIRQIRIILPAMATIMMREARVEMATRRDGGQLLSKQPGNKPTLWYAKRGWTVTGLDTDSYTL